MSNGLVELIRHASSLRGSAEENLIDMLQTISKVSTNLEATECQFISTIIPMKAELEEEEGTDSRYGQMINNTGIESDVGDDGSILIFEYTQFCYSHYFEENLGSFCQHLEGQDRLKGTQRHKKEGSFCYVHH